jgi:hypothetical protein
MRVDSLTREMAMDADDVTIAIDELRSYGLVELSADNTSVFVTNRFFWDTDPIVAESDPVTDAVAVARMLVHHGGNQMAMGDLAAALGWTARRLNPATTLLVDAGIVDGLATISAPFWTTALFTRVATKRFVRDLDRDDG